MIILARPASGFNHKLISVLELVSGVGFVAIGVLGLILASGFLNNAFLPLGQFRSLLSAGVIPIIYVFSGIKVGSELTGILDSLRENQNEI